MNNDIRFTDRDHLKNEQYRDGGNLRSRISLHEQYSANPTPWHTWVFDQFDLPPSAAILEVGCGPGLLWLENLARVPEGWRMILSDLSPGMVHEARHNLRDAANIAYLCFDIGRAPLRPTAFNAVIANHMLYHVPDVGRALATIHGLLKPGGVLYAATNGRTHLQELAGFVSQARGETTPEADNLFQRSARNFTLQSGAQQLLAHFAAVELRAYPDSLEIDDVEAIIRYVQSSALFGLSAANLDRLRALLQEEIRAHGAVTITKESGLFIARKVARRDDSSL
ncbi:MAG: class I SAM-dependent methyltransferase [Candidatus Promineifilaceae bacterium]|jgi:SAM-dependent methyltransferase